MPPRHIVYLTTDDTVHHAVEWGEQLLTDEGCNLDDAAKRTFYEQPPAGYKRCQRCFPPAQEESDG
jgi:hypothetical protein